MFSHTFMQGFVGDDNYEPTGQLMMPAKAKERQKIRIFVTGEKEAGKTALIVRMSDSSYRRIKYTLVSGYQDVSVQIGENAADLHIVDMDAKLNAHYSYHRAFSNDKYDAEVAFVVVKLSKKKSADELRLLIQNKCQAVQKIAPGCQIVLVASKADKIQNITLETIKNLAIEFKCFGAVVIDDSLKKVSSLFQATVDCLFAQKKRLAPPVAAPAPKQAHASPAAKHPIPEERELITLARHGSANSPRFFSNATHPPRKLSPEQALMIDDIGEYLLVLKGEICSCMAFHRRRKLTKIEAMKDLIVLIKHYPDTPVTEHIDTIRKEYEGKELEVGTRTLAIFADLIRQDKLMRAGTGTTARFAEAMRSPA